MSAGRRRDVVDTDHGAQQLGVGVVGGHGAGAGDVVQQVGAEVALGVGAGSVDRGVYPLGEGVDQLRLQAEFILLRSSGLKDIPELMGDQSNPL